MIQIKIIPPAEQDIKEIYDYIKYHYRNKPAANKFLNGIKSRINDLKQFPLQGVEYRKKYRKIKYEKYSIVYEFNNDVVTIIAIE